MTAEKLTRMKADTFRARLRLGLGFAGPVHVPETLKLRDTAVDRLCDTLCVDGDLDLAGCSNLEQLPERLIVRGKLILDGCAKLETLPPTLREVGALSAVDCPRLTSIAPVAECRGELTLLNCEAMQPLPPYFCAGTKVTVSNCTIYPDHLRFEGSIPETLMIALPGRGLGEIIDHPLLTGHPVLTATIEKADHNEYLGKIMLEADYSALVSGL